MRNQLKSRIYLKVSSASVSTPCKNQGNLKKQVLGMALYISMYVIVYCLCIDVVYGLLQFGIILVYPIMSLYDGTRGKSTFMKWFFYWFYVGHLVLCGLIRVMM